MRLVYLLSLFFILISCNSNIAIRKLEKNVNTYGVPFTTKDTIITQLQKNYSLLIFSNMRPHSGHSVYYYFIGLKKKKWYNIVYRYTQNYIAVNGPKPFIYNTESIDNALADSVLRIFVNNEFWKIKAFDEVCTVKGYNGRDMECGYGNIPYKEIGILNKNKLVSKIYYNPEYLDSVCCPGNIDGLVFIKCMKALKKVNKSQFL